jgi:hypothetical protein
LKFLENFFVYRKWVVNSVYEFVKLVCGAGKGDSLQKLSVDINAERTVKLITPHGLAA